MIKETITAAMAGKPMATSSGAATAAGVPNPADASIKEPKRKAMMMACTRRSGEMRNILPRIAKIAPLSSCRFKSRIAPRTIYRIEAAVMRPSREAAAIWRNGAFQTAKASMQVMAYATGMALVAGHLKRTMSPKTVMMGRRASRASIPKLISRTFSFVLLQGE